MTKDKEETNDQTQTMDGDQEKKQEQVKEEQVQDKDQKKVETVPKGEFDTLKAELEKLKKEKEARHAGSENQNRIR